MCSPDNPINKPYNTFMSLGSGRSFWKASENTTSIKLLRSIQTHFIFQLPCCIVITVGPLSWGRIMTASMLEKVMSFHDSPCSQLENPRNITFMLSTCLAYFLREELELPPPAKPVATMLTLECSVLSAIFCGRQRGWWWKRCVSG